jgi:hypothetical protein
MWWTQVGAALESCHHANDQLWRADLLLADEALKRAENCQVSGEMARGRSGRPSLTVARCW